MKQSPRTESSNSMHAAPTHPSLIFRPKRRTSAAVIIFDEPAPQRTGPRFRTSSLFALGTHALVLLAWLFFYPSLENSSPAISEISFEEEAPLAPPEAARAILPQAEPRPVLVTKPARNVAIVPAPAHDERGAQENLATNLPETNPNAGGTSLSLNDKLDIPGKMAALNLERPPARGAGSRGRGDAFTAETSLKLANDAEQLAEATLQAADFAADALAATSLFRNRGAVRGNGLQSKQSGVGIALGSGTGAGNNAGEMSGGKFGGIGGGMQLGGGGYGTRPGRGAGNGRGSGIGNGTQVGIAAGESAAGATLDLHDLVVWMKAHPGVIPKLVQHDMEHRAGDLASAVSFALEGNTYELFLSCSENDMLLRICLIEGRRFTMLKDNGIKAASNFLAMGEVVRAGAAIQSLITSRQAPGEVAQQFYRIFWQWWEQEQQ